MAPMEKVPVSFSLHIFLLTYTISSRGYGFIFQLVAIICIDSELKLCVSCFSEESEEDGDSKDGEDEEEAEGEAEAEGQEEEKEGTEENKENEGEEEKDDSIQVKNHIFMYSTSAVSHIFLIS